MGALSKLAQLEGAAVTGSDAGIAPGHDAGNIHTGIDLVIYNGAISDDNVELVHARKLGIETMGREQFLAHIEAGYKNRIAVAGSHGKSTTTAMIGAVLVAGGLEPTVHNGAHPNLVVGGKDYFVTEACEFKRSLLRLSPTVAVITNVDFDHVDCYRDLDDIKSTFDQFARKAQVVFRGDEVNTQELVRGLKLRVPGRHNYANAALAVAVGRHFGIQADTIKHALEGFGGISRRFETLGKIGDCDLITDYAHHPAEINALVQTAAGLYKRFLIVFQPHTYTRTAVLFDGFVHALGKCDCVLYRTFSAREKPLEGGAAGDLARALGRRSFARGDALRRYLVKVAFRYDAIILTGAGDLYKLFNN